MPPTEHPHHEPADARQEGETSPAEGQMRAADITALFDEGRRVEGEIADEASRRAALKATAKEDAAEDQTLEAAELARSNALISRAKDQQGELAGLLAEKDGASSGLDASRRALRNADSVLNHLLQDALRRAGTYELYAGLSETARRLAAQTDALARRGRIN